MYMDIEGPTKPIQDLNKICHRIPTHLILGQIADLMYVEEKKKTTPPFQSFFSFQSTKIYFVRPAHVHKALIDPNSGRQYASISWAPGIGHLVRGIPS